MGGLCGRADLVEPRVHRHPLDPLPDLHHLRRVLRVVQIPRELEVEPELRTGAEKRLEPDGGVRADAPLALDDLVHPVGRDADHFGEPRLRDPMGLEELLEVDAIAWTRLQVASALAERIA